MPHGLRQRDAELAALGRQLAVARRGAGRVVLVEGPAGIGKSSLLAAAAAEAAAGGMRVLRAWGGPLEHDAGWGIARQLFAPVRAGEEWAGLATGAAALARRALDGDHLEPALTGDAMHAAAHGLIWLACGLTDRGPVALVVDDVHWADAPSLRWLVQLTRQLPDLPLAIVAAVRSGEVPAEPGLVGDLLAAAPEPPVRPAPLTAATVRALVDERMPAAADGFSDACHAATAGNPFLVGALLDQLTAEGRPPSAEAAAELGSYGAEQVTRRIERQLARMPAGAAALARAFAVLGRAAPLRCAAALAGLDPAGAARLADRLQAAGLLDGGDGRYGLIHPLVAAALYDGMPPGERATWHARAARVLPPADTEAVALHLIRTEPTGDPAVVAALRTAADRTARRGAPENAATFLRRALAEGTGEAGVRADLGLVLAVSASPEAPALLTEAVDLAVPGPDRSRLALTGARALGLAGYFDDALRLCRRGLDHPSEVDADLEAELAGNAFLHTSGVAEARERTRRAGPATPLWQINAAWDEICAAAPAGGARKLLTANPTESLLGTAATLSLIACGDFDEARARSTALIDLARPRGWLIALAHGSFMRAVASVPAGLIREAAADARFAFDFKLLNSPPAALVWGLFPLVEALTELDEQAAADTALQAAGPLDEGALTTALLRERRARLRLAQHRPADACADLTAAARIWAAFGICHPGLAAWRVDTVTALVERGEPGAARPLAEEHLELAGRLGLPGPRGAGLRALAATMPSAAAVAVLEEAVALLDGSPARLEHVRVLVELGAALRRAGRRAAAREPLGRALDLAGHGGMRLLGRRARDELLAAGGRPRRTARTGLDALTPAEHRVAVLAAAGRGNREIAQELYVTRRTVETHLTHAFRKLGVTTRTGLSAHVGAPAD